MISYHPTSVNTSTPQSYANGFIAANTNDVSRLTSAIVRYVWSPIVWKNGVRRQSEFIQADWCVLDFDTPELTLQQAKRNFCDMIHAIGTTKSHGKLKNGIICDRYRVLLLFSRPIILLNEYRYNMQKAISAYPADPACKDGARFFYPCTEIVQFSAEGYSQDVLEVPASQETEEGYIRSESSGPGNREGGRIPRWVEINLEEKQIPKGERNLTLFRMAKDCARAGLLEEHVYQRFINSKTFKSEMNNELKAEIRKLVSRCFKTVMEENMQQKDKK